jgi:hypothetical protein
VVFRRTPPVVTDPPPGTASHLPNTGGCSRSVSTGLWQRRADGPACLSYIRRRQSVLNAAARMIVNLRRSDQYHRRAGQPTLAARPGANPV